MLRSFKVESITGVGLPRILLLARCAFRFVCPRLSLLTFLSTLILCSLFKLDNLTMADNEAYSAVQHESVTSHICQLITMTMMLFVNQM